MIENRVHITCHRLARAYGLIDDDKLEKEERMFSVKVMLSRRFILA
jgi:hypothetical protein